MGPEFASEMVLREPQAEKKEPKRSKQQKMAAGGANFAHVKFSRAFSRRRSNNGRDGNIKPTLRCIAKGKASNSSLVICENRSA